MDIEQLKQAHQKAVSQQLFPIATIAIAGTTETGNIDPMPEIADFCHEHKLHFHVDAAWGGGLLMSETSKQLLEGIERADSVVVDGHKQLYLPMGVGMLFFKDPQLAEHIQHQTQYIIRKGSFDLGRRHLEGSRAGMSLLVNSAIRIIGKQGYELLVERSLSLAKTFAKMIDEHPDFELITAPQLNILTYRFYPKAWSSKLTLEITNELNIQLQKRQRERGQSFVSRTRFRHPEPSGPSYSVLRAVLANPLTKTEHLKGVLEEQVKLGEQWLQNNPATKKV
jgi:glutamate decarboxylase